MTLISGGDGTHNNSNISISTYGSGGSSSLTFRNGNWSGGYYFERGASGGYFKQVRIVHGGGSSGGYQTGYGILDVYGTNGAIGTRLNGGGNFLQQRK